MIMDILLSVGIVAFIMGTLSLFYKKYKDRDKHRRYEKNKMNLESAKQNEFDCQERFR
jgi:hypothetical protein